MPTPVLFGCVGGFLGAGKRAAEASVRENGESLDVDLSRVVVVAEGQALSLALKPSAATT